MPCCVRQMKKLGYCQTIVDTMKLCESLEVDMSIVKKITYYMNT